MNWQSIAPSNIALIKYMGKKSSKDNKPTNPSLSYTLNSLNTKVIISKENGNSDRWAPLQEEDWKAPQLSEKGQARYLSHFQNLKRTWDIPGHYRIESGNNFPSDCGLASSASSFAALTLAAFELAKSKSQNREKIEALRLEDVANESRKGSGSSCRSFLVPWCEWNENGVVQVRTQFEKLKHEVILVETEKKEVSSSEAHKRVLTSDMFEGRVDRVKNRLVSLKSCLSQSDSWSQMFRICWSEFWDMHVLFETSQPSFGYMTSGTLSILRDIQSYWNKNDDGPLVTMDAGANIHLLYRPGQNYLSDTFASWSQQARFFRS